MIATPGWRRLTLFLHLTSGIGFIGAVAAFLALAVAGVMDAPPGIYVALKIITWSVIVPLAISSLGIGIISSLTTPWGLFKHYWVCGKLVLTLIALVVLMLQTGAIDALAADRAAPEDAAAMVVHSAGGLVVLLAIMVLSIYKPRGTTASRI